MKLVTVTHRIPEHLNERLAYAAVAHKKTKQAIVTEALEKLLDEYEADKKGIGGKEKMTETTLRELFPNNQYVAYSGNTGHTLDLCGDHGNSTTATCERLPDTTLGALRRDHPGDYAVIAAGGIEGLSDDYPVEVYEIDDGIIYRLEDWQ